MIIYKKPDKKIACKKHANFDFNWVSKKVSLKVFNDWCKSTVPLNSKDVTLELVEEWDYDNGITYLKIEWEETMDNPNYEKQLKKYEKQLKK